MASITINDVHGFAILVTELVEKVGKKFIRANNAAAKNVTDLQIGGREIKLEADTMLEKELIKGLSHTGIAILSEETGFIPGKSLPQLLWVIDPLDGSYNFSRNLGPSMISVALWDENEPVLGVLFNLVTKQMIFGGPQIGAHVGKNPVTVSDRKDRGQATLVTGFPSRFPINDAKAAASFAEILTSFGKVRMIGSACASLALVATGSADVYAEHNIMFWDIAAGLAIVNGAGGTFQLEGVNLTEGVFSEPCTVVASNNKFDVSVTMFDKMRGIS
ncbi:MAG: inositol monophosphatase family protein [Acidimicrobiaceae bacterium]